MGPVKRQRQTVLGDTWQKDKRLQVKFLFNKCEKFTGKRFRP